MRANILWLPALMVFAIVACTKQERPSLPPEEKKHYPEVSHPTPNILPDTLNEMLGIVLHHTALPTAEAALHELTRPRGVSSHVVIDTDGKRYILAPPTAITFHAGKSLLNGRERCNNFCIGVEFQGNTAQVPLTKEQIESGVEYLLPLVTEHHIPLDNIVTHKMVRDNFIHHHPQERRCKTKVDISSSDYARFMNALKASLDSLQTLSK
ncbi:MAG: N-acetylmuramoyl-L-alanine amidase [Prevotella sp.]|nr:N-acetylmuramoyl-L-alanine amidase [Prevotella sp.]MBR7055192.1 N-acetylmuramoyl-L-alanine amidase [Prevotella sp.]